MSKTANIVAAAWLAYAAWQIEKEDRSGKGAPVTWKAILHLFAIMDEE